MFKKIVIIAIVIQAIILSYFLLFQQYFQQDEWHGFGIILSQGMGYVTKDQSIIELLLGDRIGARTIAFGLFNLFHLNPLPYGIFALIMQILNVFLVFLLSKKITKQSNIAIFSSFLFMLNELGNEAYSWFGTMTGSLTSVFFFLLSLIFFLKFIDIKKIRYMIISTLLLWVSFLFKEVGGFAFIFYPIIFFIYSKGKKNIQTLIKNLLPLIILGTIMLIFFLKTVIFIPGDRANYVDSGRSFVPTMLTHAIQYPLEGIMQTIVPNYYLFKLSDITTKIIRPNLQPDSLDFLIASQTFGAEITIIGLLIIGIFTIWALRKVMQNFPLDSKKTLFFSLVMTALSFIPYIVINRSFSYFDSRYYYLGTIGISIFLATLSINLAQTNKKIVRFAIIIISLFYITMHETTLFADFRLMAERSGERQSFLRQIDNLTPQLPKKSVFFIDGDSEGYYGLSELKVPFQSGLGHVLMTYYTVKNQLSPRFFDEDTKNKLYDVGFLYDTLGQGYREVGEQGFGYYYDQKELNEALGKKLFLAEDVISLYYESQNRQLIRKDSKL